MVDGTVKKPSPRRLPRAGEVRAAVILSEVARIATERNNGDDGSNGAPTDQDNRCGTGAQLTNVNNRGNPDGLASAGSGGES